MDTATDFINRALIGKRFAHREGRTPDYVVTGSLKVEESGDIVFPVNYIDYDTQRFSGAKKSGRSLSIILSDRLVSSHPMEQKADEEYLIMRLCEQSETK